MMNRTLINDKRIQRYEFDDWFLQAYEARDAITARATLFTVMIDDELEQKLEKGDQSDQAIVRAHRRSIAELLYRLSFAQQRASGAIAIPAPIAAADMAAYRARFYCDLASRPTLDKLEAPALHRFFL